MAPVPVAPRQTRRRGRELRIVAVEPNVDVEKVTLFCPEHAGESLPLNVDLFAAAPRRMHGLVELICLANATFEQRVDNVRQAIGWYSRILRPEPHVHGERIAGLDLHA